MRLLLSLLLVCGGALAAASNASAIGKHGCSGDSQTCLIENCKSCRGDACGDACGDDCGCGNGILGKLGKKNKGCMGAGIQGLDPWFNCGCNGSYKFPVPPLYTYHWPGMFSHQLMTDYHSPWRFPPLKPYVDEIEVIDNLGPNTAVPAPLLIRPTSATTPVEAQPASRLDRIDPIGAAMRARYGQ